MNNLDSSVNSVSNRVTGIEHPDKGEAGEDLVIANAYFSAQFGASLMETVLNSAKWIKVEQKASVPGPLLFPLFLSTGLCNQDVCP